MYVYEHRRRARVLNPSNGRCTRVGIEPEWGSGVEISWEMPTDCISPGLRRIGSEFFVVATLIHQDEGDDVETIRLFRNAFGKNAFRVEPLPD